MVWPSVGNRRQSSGFLGGWPGGSPSSDDADHLLAIPDTIADARKGNRDGLERDLITYHAQHRPAHHADFVLVTDWAD